jgi:hypothetical protein
MSTETPPFLNLPPAPGKTQRSSALPAGVAPGYADRPQRVVWIPREGWPADLSFLNPNRPTIWIRDGNEYTTREEADEAYGGSVDPLASTGPYRVEFDAQNHRWPEVPEPITNVVFVRVGREFASQEQADAAFGEGPLVPMEQAFKTPEPEQPKPETPDGKPLVDATVPEKTAKRRGRPPGSANKKKEAAADAKPPILVAAEQAVTQAEADLAAAKEAQAVARAELELAESRAVTADKALALAQAVADWAHAHPALQQG